MISPFAPGDILRIKEGIVYAYDENMNEHHSFDSFTVLSSAATQDEKGTWHWHVYVLSSSNEFGTLDALYLTKVFP